MITIFNRKEVLLTMDMKRQADARRTLAENNIDYIVNTTNLLSAPIAGSGRMKFGSGGVDMNYAYEYKIYVHRKDYDRAIWLIGSMR